MFEKETAQRLEKVYKRLSEEKLDGLLVTNKVNAAYLSGMHQIEAYLLISSAGNYYLTDFRYLEDTQRNLPSCFRIIELKGPLGKVLNRLARKNKFKRLGFESKSLSYELYRRLRDKSACFNWVETTGLVEDLRLIKDVSELEQIRKAVKVSAAAWNRFVRFLKSRPVSAVYSEKTAADKLEYLLRKCGASGAAFDIICACGPNISKPHAWAGQDAIDNNQPLLFDFGAVYQGYHSDISRTILPARATKEYRRIYQIVSIAQRRAIEAIKPGRRISDIDCLARDYITARGLGKRFGHALGHGLGLEVHEAPVISKKNRSILKTGMVFTVEPGIYIPGWGGVRIEDMVLVTEKGCEVLTDDIDESVKERRSVKN